MAQGPGKYDDALTVAREACGSTAALLIVLNGRHGPGFSMQAEGKWVIAAPALLRAVADEIEAGHG